MKTMHDSSGKTGRVQIGVNDQGQVWSLSFSAT